MTNTEKYLGQHGTYALDNRVYQVIEIDANGNCALERRGWEGVITWTNISQVHFPVLATRKLSCCGGRRMHAVRCTL